MINLEEKLKTPVCINGVKFPNPIWLASGTCGYGEELSEIIDLNLLGGLVIKGTTLKPRDGNLPPRVVETPSGLLNSIGLQNPGIKEVLKNKIPFLKQFKMPIIINISGESFSEYAKLTKLICEANYVQAIEVNISCPNVKKGGLSFGTNPKSVFKVISSVKKVSKVPVIAKLSPNVTDITLIAAAAEDAGADAISLINTLQGMRFDLKTQKPVLANCIGGLSGPAIKPIALRMVYQVKCVTKLPIIGMGGISSMADIFEFFIAGADIIQIGTLNLTNVNQVKSILEKVNS
ncbi:MAG: dihydroorotate dehydrogenase [Candidatus Margulisiibacteriota bacterium]|jgi:dihydroorotate dehydrogenase (NAD+) catalytic subunit